MKYRRLDPFVKHSRLSTSSEHMAYSSRVQGPIESSGLGERAIVSMLPHLDQTAEVEVLHGATADKIKDSVSKASLSR